MIYECATYCYNFDYLLNFNIEKITVMPNY